MCRRHCCQRPGARKERRRLQSPRLAGFIIGLVVAWRNGGGSLRRLPRKAGVSRGFPRLVCLFATFKRLWAWVGLASVAWPQHRAGRSNAHGHWSRRQKPVIAARSHLAIGVAAAAAGPGRGSSSTVFLSSCFKFMFILSSRSPSAPVQVQQGATFPGAARGGGRPLTFEGFAWLLISLGPTGDCPCSRY